MYFSAVTHKLNVNGHMFIWTLFLFLVFGTLAQSLSVPLSCILYSVRDEVCFQKVSILLATLVIVATTDTNSYASI
jgi:hypothetical protein